MELNVNLRHDLASSLNKERELVSANQMLRDEYQALQLAFASLEEKLRKSQVKKNFALFLLKLNHLFKYFLSILGRESTIGRTIN